MTANEKLQALRLEMARRNIDVYLVPSADAHQSEYVTAHWRARAYLTGFDGSAGRVAVTQTEAGLWTDGRYFIQAERQLAGSGVVLYRMDVPGVPEYNDWIRTHLPQGGCLGFDGRVLSAEEFDALKRALAYKSIRYHTDSDLVDAVWPDRPPLPDAAAFAHGAAFEGAPRADKLAAVRREMRERDADCYLSPALDSNAWLLNIRGADIPNTPVVYCFCLIDLNGARVFIDPAKLTDTLRGTIAADGYTLLDYGAIEDALRGLPDGARLLYQPKLVNARLAAAVPSGVSVLHAPDIVMQLKAVKSPAEIACIREAHLKDGAVMTRLLAELDAWAQDPDARPMTERDVSDRLLQLRAEQPHFIGPSFDTIAAYGANAASMHYTPEGAGAELRREGFLLVDTGGQYLDGTTDITRTVVLGAVTDEMRRDFTLVLKGHIALARAVFPQGTFGISLDALARAQLWNAGLNYRSGTGHGLGYCLGVHENPPNLAQRLTDARMAAGMLVTDEPGVYKEGRYGIRTENVLLTAERCTHEDGVFLSFEAVSLCPVDRRAIDRTLLTAEETAFLDGYHARVYEALAPRLNENERVWLSQATRPL